MPLRVTARLALAALAAVSSCQSNEAGASAPSPAAAPARPQPRRVAVSVTAEGYEPAEVEARAGETLTLVFERTSDQGCGQQLVFPGRGIRRPLPLNQEVEVELTPKENESIAFTCGMGMYEGSVVASRR